MLSQKINFIFQRAILNIIDLLVALIIAAFFATMWHRDILIRWCGLFDIAEACQSTPEFDLIILQLVFVILGFVFGQFSILHFTPWPTPNLVESLRSIAVVLVSKKLAPNIHAKGVQYMSTPSFMRNAAWLILLSLFLLITVPRWLVFAGLITFFYTFDREQERSRMWADFENRLARKKGKALQKSIWQNIVFLFPLRMMIWLTAGLLAWILILWILIRYVFGVTWRVIILCTLPWMIMVALVLTIHALPSTNIPVASNQPIISPPSAHTAIFFGDLDALRQALDREKNTETRDWQGRTLLLAALDELHELRVKGLSSARQESVLQAMVDLLLACGADTEVQDLAGRSAPMLAVTAGYIPERLAPTNPAEVTRLGTTLLHAAAASGNVELAQRMVALGTKITAHTIDGRTAMHFARGADMVRYLLALGLAVDTPDARGRTPLHYAVIGEDIKASALLSRMVLNKSGRDIFGKTASDYAPQSPAWYAIWND